MRRKVDRLIARYSLVGNDPILERSRFPWIDSLEQHWKEIRREARAILRYREAIPALSELSHDHDRLAPDRKWQSFFLWGYGYRIHDNCRRCPTTTQLVESIPGLETALFSIHAPGTHLPRHTGVTKGLVVCHLGLSIPRDREKCRIQIDDKTCFWEAGKAFVFDDTFSHEVWNDSNEDRVILLLQIDRPLLFPGSLISRLNMEAIRMSPFVQEVRRSLEHWEMCRH